MKTAQGLIEAGQRFSKRHPGVDIKELLKTNSNPNLKHEFDRRCIEFGYQNSDPPKPMPIDSFPFGKHKGVPFQDVPKSYFNWLSQQEWISKFPHVDQYMKVYDFVIEKRVADDKILDGDDQERIDLINSLTDL